MFDYGCSFVAKLSWKKNWIYIYIYVCIFYKIYIICRKNVFIWNESFTVKNFFTEKNIIENVKKCLIWAIYFYAENVCTTNKI